MTFYASVAAVVRGTGVAVCVAWHATRALSATLPRATPRHAPRRQDFATRQALGTRERGPGRPGQAQRSKAEVAALRLGNAAQMGVAG